MFYKPNYCCNCGEKIERIEWHIWTNRRFCDLCETEYRLDDWLKRLFPIVFLMIGIFGIGISLRSSETQSANTSTGKETVKPKTGDGSLKRPAVLSKSPEPGKVPTAEPAAESGDGVLTEQSSPRREAESERTGHLRSSQKASGGAVYFCGAETKKGSPCSRKVKGGGRCWQHEGRDAMLPAKELLIEDN
jgi:hypothetical protein